MPQLVEVPGIGTVQFPDDATLDEITRESNRLDLHKQMIEAGAHPATTTSQLWPMLKDQGQALLQSAQQGFGGALEGAGALSETIPFSEPGGALPPEMAAINRERATRAPGQVMADIQRNPVYVAGQALAETAPESHPVTPGEDERTYTKIPSMAGGFVPMVMAGPAAPAVIGLQTAGEHISRDYDEAKQAGMDDDQAAQRALDRALAGGTLQAGIFYALPKPVRAVAEKYLVDKLGVEGFTRWLTGRAAAAGEGAVLGGTSKAAENVVSDRPVMEGVGESAAGMAGMNLVLPWLRERPETPRPDELQSGGVSTPQEPQKNPAEPILATNPARIDLTSIQELENAMRANQVKPRAPVVVSDERNYTTEDALKDLPGVMQELKAELVRNRVEKEAEAQPAAAEPEPSPFNAEPARVTEDHAQLQAELEAELGQDNEPSPKIETDATKRQEIKNSIAEGELILRTGKFNGRVMSPEELGTVRRSVENSKARLGNEEPASQGRDVLSPEQSAQSVSSGPEPTLPETAAPVKVGRGVSSRSVFDRETAANGPDILSSGERRVNAQELNVGDVLEVDGERVKVESVDPDTGDVTLKDGRKFGSQVVKDGTSFHVEKVEPVEAGEDFPTSEPPTPEPPNQDKQDAADLEAKQQQGLFGQAEAWADKKISDSGGVQIPTPDLLAAYAIKGAGHIARGLSEFGAWARKMVSDFGQAVAPHLSKLWEEAKRWHDILFPLGEGEQRHAGIPTPGAERINQRIADTLSELPERLQNIVKWGDKARNKLVALYKAVPLKNMISATKDAADNLANIMARQCANTILHDLNRAFGAQQLKDLNRHVRIREEALTFVVESGAGVGPRQRPGELPLGPNTVDARAIMLGFRDRIRNSEFAGTIWAKRALRAIDFADQNWDKLAPIARDYAHLTDVQNEIENRAGFRTLYRKGGYVFHLQDVMENMAMPEGGTGGGGAASPFRHVRDYPTYADSIANGLSPKSLSAVDLLQKRIAMGRKLVNYEAWVDSFHDLTDSHTQLPVARPPEVRIRADGTQDVTAPAGYSLVNFGGQEIALHNGYGGMFADLTKPSWFNDNEFMRLTAQTAGLTKHLMLFFDTYHLGRLAFWNAMSRSGVPRYARGLTLLDNTSAEIRNMAARGEIPQAWAHELTEQKIRLDLLTRSGLNIGKIADNLNTHWIEHVPAVGAFNHWLFERYQRGAMSEVALLEFERQRKMYAKESENMIARRVAREVNTRFGSLGSQGFFRSKTGSDLARVIFLAPQWNESLIRSELGAVKEAGMAAYQAVRDPKWAAEQLMHGRLPMGMMAKTVGASMLGQFMANQAINWYTRGKPTWENPEEDFGAKISAWIPDKVGGGPGFFLNPLSLPAEITHLLMKSAERHGYDYTQAVKDFLRGRLNLLSGEFNMFWTREDKLGRKARTGTELVKNMGAGMLPTPISAGAIGRGVKQLATGENQEAFPGQFQSQIMQSAGLKTDRAPSPEQRIQRLATEWMREQKGYKPSPEFSTTDFSDLETALRMGNITEARASLEALEKIKTMRQIAEHFKTKITHPFTRSRAAEGQFLQTLNDEQKGQWRTALEDRRAMWGKVFPLLREKLSREPAATE